MFELIKNDTNIDFMGKVKYVVAFSLFMIVASIYGIFTQMNYGVDFRGGAEIQTKFEKSINLDHLREALNKGGLKGVSVQTIGEEQDHEVLIKVQAEEGALNTLTQKITEELHREFADNKGEIQKVDIVGPKAGKQLRSSGIQAMFWALLSIMLYVAVRFDFRYAPGAIISLTHDVIIVTGIIAWTGNEFSLQSVAALLAIIGYSINDTVVIYDRIREQEQKDNTKSLKQHINDAVNNTLSRTILTSMATLLVSASMYFFGGIAIRDFFFPMTLGIIFGTYSTVYVAAMITWYTDVLMKKMNAKKKHAAAA